MKTLRYFLATSLLTLTLTTTAFGGEMTTGVATPQPASTPAPAEGEMSAAADGDTHAAYGDGATAGDVAAAGALSLLQGVLALL